MAVTTADAERHLPRLWGVDLEEGVQQIAGHLLAHGAAVFGVSGELTGMQISLAGLRRDSAGGPVRTIVSVGCGSFGGAGEITLGADRRTVQANLRLAEDDAATVTLLLAHLADALAGETLPDGSTRPGWQVTRAGDLLITAVDVRHFMFTGRAGEPPAQPDRYRGWAFVGARSPRKGGAYWLPTGLGRVDAGYLRAKLNLPHASAADALRALARVRLA